LLLGCFQALEYVGRRCPEDVSIIGFDDFPWNETFRPAITTVAQPTVSIGFEAMEMLLQQISADGEGREIPDQNVVLRPELRVRKSTAPLPQALLAPVPRAPTIGPAANR
jgi:LacI family transcriptional regulator